MSTTPMQSWAFILFVLIGVLLYWLAVPRRFRPHYLLLISLGYYLACSVDVFFLPFIFLVIYLYGMFVFGVMIDTAASPRGKKAWLIIGVALAVGILFLFKSIEPATNLVFKMFGIAGGQLFAAAMKKFGVPLGISYFTFRVIHYLVEVYRGKERRATYLEFMLYTTFFPTMVSGPIHRFFTIFKENPADSFAPQLRGEGGTPPFKFDDISYGVWRILQGLVKKFVIAEFFFRMAEPMMKIGIGLAPGTQWWHLWLSGHCYFAYLYADFSGYSDLAIGIARLFGFRIMENFNWGILAPNMRDFWRRWHISLTQWLMAYIYIPLGGGKKSNMRTNFNAMVTILAVALWHKVAVHMFLWGFFQGIALLVFRYWDKIKRHFYPNRTPTWWGKIIGIVIVWHVMCFLWPIFLHPTKIAIIYWAKMVIVPLAKLAGGQGG